MRRMREIQTSERTREITRISFTLILKNERKITNACISLQLK